MAGLARLDRTAVDVQIDTVAEIAVGFFDVSSRLPALPVSTGGNNRTAFTQNFKQPRLRPGDSKSDRLIFVMYPARRLATDRYDETSRMGVIERRCYPGIDHSTDPVPHLTVIGDQNDTGFVGITVFQHEDFVASFSVLSRGDKPVNGIGSQHYHAASSKRAGDNSMIVLGDCFHS